MDTSKRHRDFVHGVELLIARGSGRDDGPRHDRETLSERRPLLVRRAAIASVLCSFAAYALLDLRSTTRPLEEGRLIEVGTAVRGFEAAAYSTPEFAGDVSGDAEGSVVGNL